MSICKGRTVSDSFKFPFYDSSGEVTNQYYFTSLGCRNQAITNELCGSCLEKEQKLKGVTINGNKIKDSSGKRIWQPRVLHGKIDTTIPPWSQIEDSEWFISMLKKGFRKQLDMAPRKKVETLVEEKSKKKVKDTSQTNISKNTSNVITELKSKLYVDNTVKEEVLEVLNIEVKPIKIQNVQYYYDFKKNKVYTTDYEYVGRYDTKSELLCTEYPDSDSEPSF